MVVPAFPLHSIGKNAILRNLRDPKEGKDMLVDIALQGPKSVISYWRLAAILQPANALGAKTHAICEAVVGGYDWLFPHREYGRKMLLNYLCIRKISSIWKAIMEAGTPLFKTLWSWRTRFPAHRSWFTLVWARNGGELNLGVAEAGFGSYVKTITLVIGREAFLGREQKRKTVVVRFRFTELACGWHICMTRTDQKGRVIGVVTSCAIDSEGYLTGRLQLT